ncbi:MAG: glycosyltransferase [Sphingobacterium sp.]|jgi:GT2 family glycosyltransferase|nr:glycosyltransferase [Sphingobacterium sp.]
MNNIIDKILAIVVIYNKGLSDSETLISLGADIVREGSVLDLFIYDNSAIQQSGASIRGFNILNHHFDGENVGVSAAYNMGAKYAKALGKEWVLLLDQDTSFFPGALKEYCKNVEENSEVNLFSPIIKLASGVIFSPFKKIFKRGIALKEVSPIRYSLKRYAPVNSGILVRVAAFEMAGGYNEKVKLDFSDMEFISRFSNHNDNFKVINTICLQDFSNDITDVEVLNRRFAFFCDGVKNCRRKNVYEDFQYFVVVLIRLIMLMVRTRKTRFITTFYKNYIK